MALSRKQQLIHLHGSSKEGLNAKEFKSGELLILHAADGHAEFGTRVGDTLRWAPDQETIKALIDKSLSGIQADAVTSISGDTYVSASKKGNNVALTTDVVTDFSKEIGEDRKLADAQAIKTYVDGLNTTASGKIDAINAKLGTGFTSGSTATAQLAEVKKTADAALKTVTGENAIVATTGESQSVKVTLKSSDKGNVKFTNDEDGLSAKVDLTAAETVTGISTDDKVLSLSNKLISATVSLDYYTIPDGNENAGKKYIRLLGKDKTVISTVDATEFIKDGMLESAELKTNPDSAHTGTFIILTWNYDSGKKDPMYIDVASLIDVYTADEGTGLKLTDHKFSIDTTKIATVDSVNNVKNTIDAYTINGEKISTSPILNATQIKVSADSGSSTVAEAIKTASEAGVQSFGGQKGEITVKTADEADVNGTVQFTIGENKKLTAVVKGIDSAAYKKAEDFDEKGAAAAVLGKDDDPASAVTVYGVKKALSEKNVSAEGQSGDTALVTASAAENKVTVGVTDKLTEAVASAETALQTATVKNTESNKITATKTSTKVEFDFDNMIIDCGTF